MLEQLLNDIQHRMEKPRGPDPTVWVIAAALVSAVITFLVTWYLDPRLGRRRRTMTVDRVASRTRKIARRSERGVRRVTASAEAVGQRVSHLRQPDEPPANDAELAHKVESVLFRDPEIDKGSININAESGVVVLRGTVDGQERIDDLVKRVQRIDGVRDVRSLLHPTGTPAPGWEEAAHASSGTSATAARAS
jgi:hypothetical protein